MLSSVRRVSLFFVVIGLLFIGISAQAFEPRVNQSERQIPIAYDVDLVVVGGSTGACAAAIEAADQGADVMLVSPFPYLGDDMTATLRLWLEPGEVPTDPLAVEIFNDPLAQNSVLPQNRLAFQYQTDRASDAKHRDTTPAGKLADGKSSSASTDSVQYNSDVAITCDLGEVRPIADIQLLSFLRDNVEGGPDNFKVGSVTYETSSDGTSWTRYDTVLPKGQFTPVDGISPFALHLEEPIEIRYVRLTVAKADDVERILLGEIMILAPSDQAGDDALNRTPAPRPMHVKRVLDNALINAGVKFLYSSHVTDVLHDAQGKPAGVVIANRSGRQAIRAKMILDATDRAYTARMAGATFTEYPAGPQTIEYVVIGGQPDADAIECEIKGMPFVGAWPNATQTSSGEFPIYNYRMTVDMPDASWASWQKAENAFHMATFHDEQQFAADRLFQVPPDTMISAKADAVTDATELPITVFQSADVKNVYVLNGCADIPRDSAAALLRPLNLIEMGRQLGKHLADVVKVETLNGPAQVASVAPVADPASPGDVGEVLVGVRPTQELPTLTDPARSLPVLGEYDVVVIGGGTSGAPAGIGAARAGAKTLVVEYLHTLGGVGTTGAISSYYWGNRVGFTATIPGTGRWVIEQKMHWWRSEVTGAGADLWCGTLGVGALVDGNRVRGVVVSTPEHRGVVLADVVIDATGCSDIAYAAGAECMYTDEKELAVQGTGLPGRKLGASYANTDFTLVDDTDTVDVWHVFVYSKDKFADAFEQGKLIDTRERRRIVGGFTMTLLDQINHRTYPDTITVAYSNFDTHGYTVDPYAELEHPEKVGHYVNMPYRCSLPQGMEGILVTGLGISCHRDAIPLVRMQADLQNHGYAMGRAAATVAEQDISLRQIDITALQKHLIEIGNLPETVLTDHDNLGVSDEQLAEAIAQLPDEFKGVQVVMWADREQGQKAVRSAFIQAKTDGKQEDAAAYAQVLAVMGDPIGVDMIIDKVESYDEWDSGWNYRGMGQFGSALSPLDRLIVALGRAGDVKALPVILDKIRTLKAEDDFSHHRACALALEMLGNEQAAPVLAEHLTKPGMSGFVHDTLEKARRLDAESPGGGNAVQTRRDSIRELATARALYRCGDYNGLGEQTLRAYVDDMRGHFSRHAKAVLETTKNDK